MQNITDFIKTDIDARDALVTLLGARQADKLISQLYSAGYRLERIKKGEAIK